MPLLPAPGAYYGATVPTFLVDASESILGLLTASSQFAVDLAQRDAWIVEIEILQMALAGIDGAVFLEFVVPRIGSQIGRAHV